MSRLIARRLLEAILALIAMAGVMFFLLHLTHVSPAHAMLGQYWTPKKGAELTAKLGLDKPIPVQFVLWIKSLVGAGGLGAVIRHLLPITLEMLILGGALGYVLSVFVACLQVRYAGSVVDRALSMVTGFIGAIPGFVIGLGLLQLLTIHWVVLPATAFTPPGTSFPNWVFHHALPVVALAITVMGPWARQLRGSMGDIAGAEYIRTARAKGASESRIISRHILKNALFPFITLVGLSMPAMINTVIAFELIFGVQGAGAALLGSLYAAFFARATTIALVLAVVTVLGSLTTDIAYTLIDPRVEYR